jgi:hypothetical protein
MESVLIESISVRAALVQIGSYGKFGRCLWIDRFQ